MIRIVLLYCIGLNVVFSLYAFQDPEEENYVLVWSDEFDTDGAVNNDKWFHQTIIPQGDSWFNGELQHYTDEMENSYIQDGVLKIVAKKESYTDQGVTKDYTSARLNSKFAFTQGRVEVRAKIPAGAGTWPAIWMLGKNITENGGFWAEEFGTTSWPACGEIDIMEHWGSNLNFVQSAMHTPSSFGGTVNKGGVTLSTATTEFHVYGLEWTDDKMVFDIDGEVHYTYEPSVQDDATWPFNGDQYLLLNIAIEGNIADVNPSFSDATMEIDYVRVFQTSSGIQPTFAAAQPLEDPFKVISIYSDAYDDIAIEGLANEGAALFSEVDFNDNSTLRYSNAAGEGGNYQIIELGEENKIDMVGKGLTNFHFDVWFPETISSQSELLVKLVNTASVTSEASILINGESQPVISQGKWISYNFDRDDLMEFGLSNMRDIQQIVIDVENCGSVYLDNIYFYGSENVLSSELPLTPTLEIYPNPTSEFLNLALDNDGAFSEYDLVIYDAAGRVVNVNSSILNQKLIVDVRSLDTGVYFLNLNHNNEAISRQKFFKK